MAAVFFLSNEYPSAKDRRRLASTVEVHSSHFLIRIEFQATKNCAALTPCLCCSRAAVGVVVLDRNSASINENKCELTRPTLKRELQILICPGRLSTVDCVYHLLPYLPMPPPSFLLHVPSSLFRPPLFPPPFSFLLSSHIPRSPSSPPYCHESANSNARTVAIRLLHIGRTDS